MSILEHIINSVKDCDVDNEPFPHMYIQDFFEEKFYLKLLDALPEKEKYEQISKTGTVSDDYPEERFIFNITPQTLKTFDGVNQDIFSNIVNSFFSPNFFIKLVL